MLLNLLVFFFSSFGTGFWRIDSRLFQLSWWLWSEQPVSFVPRQTQPTVPAEPPWMEGHAAPRDERLSLTAGA
jgi:hypothetical protein